MNHHRIKVEKTAHYYTHGQISPKVKYFWIAAHGYGQLANNLMRKFEHLDEEHFVVAPEGLSHFYWEFKKAAVGASWLTKHHRLDEIADFSRYLWTIYNHFMSQLPDNVQVMIFGFSQGGTTIVRWLLNDYPKMPRFDHLILWGGVLPNELDYAQYPDFNKQSVYFVCGDKDEFIDTEKLKAHQQFATERGILLKPVHFEGRHEVLVPVLNRLIAHLGNP
jgi:predicted esterase